MSTNCIKLVSNKTKANKISFVSFKLEVPADDFEKFVDANIWPNGITVKEFVDSKPVASSFVKPKNQRPYHHANRYGEKSKYRNGQRKASKKSVRKTKSIRKSKFIPSTNKPNTKSPQFLDAVSETQFSVYVQNVRGLGSKHKRFFAHLLPMSTA